MSNTIKITKERPIHKKELINILMDSELYLDLPLEERHLLLKFIRDSYLFPSIIESNNNLSRFI